MARALWQVDVSRQDGTPATPEEAARIVQGTGVNLEYPRPDGSFLATIDRATWRELRRNGEVRIAGNDGGTIAVAYP